MSDLDLASLYLPEIEELDPKKIQALRSAVAGKIERSGSEVDTSPNTPFGDLFVTPAAMGLAMTQEAWRRFFSDMNLQNVAEGIAYNCDFVRSYLDQFGVYDETETRSFTLVRLTFNSRSSRILDRSTLFSSSGVVLRPRLNLDGPLQILSPGEPPPESGNYAWLSPLNANSWIVDILAEGDATEEDVDAGGALSLDREVPGLERAQILEGFYGGQPPVRVEDLARRARFNTHSLSPNTRGGVISGINQVFPKLETLGCLISGDEELVRDKVNPMSVSAGSMDILARGDFLVSDSITQRIDLIPDAGDNGVFFGKLALPETPIEIVSISQNGQDVENLQVISSSKDRANFPGLSAAFGDKESIYVSFPNPGSIDTIVDENSGTPVDYALFTVSYRFDPQLKMVQSLLSGDRSPVGIKTYVRYFNPIKVESMNIVFNRKAGTALNLANARKEILERLNRHHFHSPASPADIIDSFYYSGAHSVERIEIDARIRYSCADRVYLGEENLDSVRTGSDYSSAIAETEEVVHPSPVSFMDPVLRYSTPTDQYGAVGPRSVSWRLDSRNLIFTENRTLG